MKSHPDTEDPIKLSVDFHLQQDRDKIKCLIKESNCLFERFMANIENEEIFYPDHEQLISKWKRHENETINFSFLNIVYCAISRCYLNIADFNNAISYALAGLELSKYIIDNEGIVQNASVLLDTAISLGANESALKIIKDYPDTTDAEFLSELSYLDIDKDGECLFNDLINSKERPESLKVALDESLILKETKIRILMKQHGIKRQQAISDLRKIGKL